MNSRRLLLAGLLAMAAVTASCKGGTDVLGNSPPPPPPTPPPSISSLSPASATAGGPGFTLSLTGSNFANPSTVQWIDTANPGFVGGTATFVSATQLTLQISAANIAIPASVKVTVSSNGTSSNTLTFAINPGPPVGAQLISSGAGGAIPNGNSHNPALSFNGRFVAFSSEATNLIVPNANFAEAYVRDTCLGVDSCTPSTLLASAENGGPAASPIEGNSLGGASPSFGWQGFLPPSGALSLPAGRYIGFLSTANNLVTPTTAFQQAYMRDTCFGAAAPSGCVPSTILASVTDISGEPNGAASEFVLASNTCNGAFVSAGTNLVNGVAIPNEVYLVSCGNIGLFQFGFTNTTLVSAGFAGAPGDQGGHQPAISPDGRFVAFASTSSNLTSVPNGGNQQIYLRDTCLLIGSGCTPSTTMISVDSAGNALGGSSQIPALSDDARFVVFSTQTPAPGGGVTSDVLLHDTCNSSGAVVAGCTPSTVTISVAANGASANGPSNSSAYAVSGDGRFVAFSSSGTNILAGGNAAAQVFVRDTCNASSGSIPSCTPRTVLISSNGSGPIGGLNGAISHDGHFVAFENQTSISQIFVAATGF
jgi:hypothetical protein